MDTLSMDTYQVYFVLEAGKSTASASMKKAFAAIEENDLIPTWIETEDVLVYTSSRPSLFVCDPFEGKAYDHLRMTSQKIFGPLCIIACLKHGDSLPSRSHPVYSVCMRRIVVTCSNMVPARRAEISRRVHLMCGQFSKDLTSSVTHVVASEVGSKKYKVAVECKLPIMLPEWVDDCWNRAQRMFIHAADLSAFSAFVCPPFKGLTISVSQIESEERKRIQTLIQRHGGTFSGPVKAKETTHVILLRPEGDKHKFALSWRLHCVTPAWLYQSIEAGYSLDENNYGLDENNPQIHGSSTPKKGQRCNVPLLGDVSTITNVSLCSHMDDTAMTDFSIAPAMHPLDAFNVTSIPKNCQFLDGCRIYPCGFSGSQMDKIQRIINAGGGTRYSKPSESVTHVVVKDKSDVARLPDICDFGAHVVSFQWLIDCCKSNAQIDEARYLCVENVPFSPQKLKESKTVLENVETSTIHGLTASVSIDYDALMKQYMPSDSNDKTTEPSTATTEAVSAEESLNKPNEKSAGSNVSETLYNNLLFSGFSFRVSDFDSQHQVSLIELIESNGGVVNPRHLSTIDYAVLPLLRDRAAANPAQLGKNVVTNCWLQMCLEQEEILPLDQNPLFRQLVVDMSCTPLSDCVLSISQYQGTERDTLMHLAEALGATCQEYFVRTVNKNRGLMPNTHLIVEEPEGSKYVAAKKWNIPAVTRDWLLVTARTGRKVNEKDFLVEFVNVPKLENAVASDAEKTTSRSEKDSEESTKQIVVPSKDSDSELTNSVGSKCRDVPSKNSELSDGVGSKCKDVPSKNPEVASGNGLLQNVRVRELIEDESSSNPPPRRNLDFLDPNSNYRPQYDLEDLMADFDSPEPDTSRRRRSSTIEESFIKNLRIACKNVGIDKSFSDYCSGPRILKGVVLYVARRLANRQSELNRLCSDLGGDYLWSYDSSCTHYVYQGKPSDSYKEMRVAKDEGKTIVSPEWLFACQEKQTRTDESEYPMTFNPRLCLSSQVQAGGETAVCQRSQAAQDEAASASDIQRQEDGDRTSSSEILCNVSKQLQELMTATTSAMVERRRTRRTNSSSGSQSPADSGARAKTTPVMSRINTNYQDHAVEPQPSQSVPIAWDDPTGRMEREKIAEQLSRTTDTQNTQQSQDVIPEECGINRTFIFSGITEQEKVKYKTILQRLGGLFLDGKQFDDTSTHLIIGSILKNEKFLSSVAAGKWVLAKSYLEESGRVGHFVDEELHEWGGPGTNTAKVQDKMREAAQCPRRWRIHVQKTQTGAFRNWRVIVAADQGVKLETYRRILQAGDATVLPVTVPYDKSQRATMAIVELAKNSELELDYEGLASAGVKCVKPEYLALFLVEKIPPLMDRYLVAPPAFANSSSRKRKQNKTTKSPKRNRQSD